MQICVIHGSPNGNGNTFQMYKRFEVFLKERCSSLAVKEFHLQKDFNEFCRGCYSCFLKSEEKCPHRKKLEPILQAMFDADGLVFTTPSYVLAEPAQMKAFLDHLGWLFITHRPDVRMFQKSARLAGLDSRLRRDAIRFLRSLKRKKRINIFKWVLLKALRPLIKSYPDDNIDKMYWRKMGWI